MSRFRYDNSYNRNRTRIDARPQGDEAVQAGMRNIHRDTRGNVIGAVTAEGQPIGTKNRGGSRFRTTEPATGNVLNARQNLYKSMQTAGGKITPEMRSKAKSLGVTDDAFDRAANRIAPQPKMEPAPITKPVVIPLAKDPANKPAPSPAAAPTPTLQPIPTAPTGQTLGLEQNTTNFTQAAQNNMPAGGVQLVGDANPDGTSRQPGAVRPGAVIKRRGGTSPTAIAGRQSTGASPSAPPAVRDQVAKQANVPAAMPDQSNQAVPKPATVAAPKPAQPTGPKINRLTGLPFGYRPGDTVAAPQQAAAQKSVDAMSEAQARPSASVASSSQQAGAQRIMERDGIVPRQQTPVPSRFRGPASQSVPIGPTKRPDGYQATSMRQDWDRDAATAQARKTGTMGDYWRKQGNQQMAAAFPNRTTNRQAAGLPTPSKETPAAARAGEAKAAATFFKPAAQTAAAEPGRSKFRRFRV